MSDRYYKYLSNRELSERYKLANLCDHSGFVRYPDGSKAFRRRKGRRESRARFYAARSWGLRRWIATQAFLSAAGWKRFGCLKSRLDTVCEKTADTIHYRLWATSKATVSADGRLRTSKERAIPIQGSYSLLPYKQKVAASTSGHFCVEKTI